MGCMNLFRKKSIETLKRHSWEGTHQLKLHLGAGQLILFGIGAIIGAGLFSLTGIAAANNAGPAIVISFIIASIGCALAGLCYSELAAMMPISGSAYTYAYATMGEIIAWIIGWDLVLEYAIGATAVAISWSAYIYSLLEDFNIHLPAAVMASPWQPVVHLDGTLEYGYINLPAILILGLMSYILIIGIEETAFFNKIMVMIKLGIIFFFIAVGIYYINPENYVPFIPENTGTFGEYGWSGIFRGAAVVFFAYIGFDAISTAAQETKEPQKAVPIGMLGSLVICTLLYIVFSSVLTGIVPYKELNVAAPVAVAIEKTPFPWLGFLIKVAILAGFTSVIMVMLLGQSRVFYAIANDGLLPKVFSKVHPKYKTPWLCNIILFVFSAAIGGFASLAEIGHLTSMGTLLAFIIVCGGVLVLRYTQPQIDRPFRVPFVPVVPILGILVCLSMMLSLSVDSWIRLFLWLLIGMVIYFSYGKNHSKN